MRWQGQRSSSNVEDRRGGGRRGAAPIGIGATLIIAGLVWALGGDPVAVVSQIHDANEAPTRSGPVSDIDPEMKAFVSVVLADTETTWTDLFAQGGQRYREPKLVLFSDAVQSACGQQSAAVGPFYCPADQKAYIDLTFFDELDKRFGAPGDFAQAYVLAHEVGHHVQNLLGTSDRIHAQKRGLSTEAANALSVRLELQADCYAGVWAHHANTKRQLLEPGDVEEGLRAATAIGDDTLQKRARGRAVPESFTHGTSAQRVKWFRTGMTEGRPDVCDTFSVEAL